LIAQEDALRMIIERVCDKKSDLYWYFTQHDEKVTGECTRLQWSEAMRTVLNLDLPFLHMQSKLCDANQAGTINYAKFLERYRIQMREQDQGWMNNTIQRVCQKLFQSCSSIEEAFKYFDLNDDGSFEYSEFVQRIKELNGGLTDNQIFELMRTIVSPGLFRFYLLQRWTDRLTVYFAVFFFLFLSDFSCLGW
jgi:Ca2+-binding EF-hand superfamily protein